MVVRTVPGARRNIKELFTSRGHAALESSPRGFQAAGYPSRHDIARPFFLIHNVGETAVRRATQAECLSLEFQTLLGRVGGGVAVGETSKHTSQAEHLPNAAVKPLAARAFLAALSAAQQSGIRLVIYHAHDCHISEEMGGPTAKATRLSGWMRHEMRWGHRLPPLW